MLRRTIIMEYSCRRLVLAHVSTFRVSMKINLRILTEAIIVQ